MNNFQKQGYQNGMHYCMLRPEIWKQIQAFIPGRVRAKWSIDEASRCGYIELLKYLHS